MGHRAFKGWPALPMGVTVDGLHSRRCKNDHGDHIWAMYTSGRMLEFRRNRAT